MMKAERNLLVIDDDPAIRGPISEFLTEVGYRVRTAEDGLSGLDEILREMPRILISDLNMPRMSGFELLPEVRRRFPSIRIIAMSATETPSELPVNVSADGFFQKGSSLLSLLSLIQNLPPRRKIRHTHVLPVQHSIRHIAPTLL